MKIKIGDKIKFIPNDDRKEKGKIGIVSEINKHFMLLDCKNYKECVSVIELKTQRSYKFYIRNNKIWKEIKPINKQSLKTV